MEKTAMKYKRFITYQYVFLFIMFSIKLVVFSCSEEKSSRTTAHPKTEEMVMALFKARSFPHIIPPLTKTYGSITIDQAYLIQDQLAEKISTVQGPIKGYKIGFASESAFEKFGITEPACGRLFKDQIVADGSALNFEDFFLFYIEAEVAFTLGKRIDKQIEDVQELKEYIQSVHASLDVSNNWYDLTMGDETVPDFVANSGGSHYFVLGSPVDPNEVDLDNLILKIFHNGENVYEGRSSAVLGSPWNAMKWIANHELKRGYPVQPGYVIVTGKVAPAFIASGDKIKGTYIGDCDDLGVISVKVK
jgi:2-keto-4-pentenoate hydratase